MVLLMEWAMCRRVLMLMVRITMDVERWKAELKSHADKGLSQVVEVNSHVKPGFEYCVMVSR